MVGFHHGDLYFPNQGNAGWLEAEPEDGHPIPLDDHHAEGFSDSSDSEPEVNNLPTAVQNPNLNPRPVFQGPTPLWATNLITWSHEQGQPIPYNGDRSFYNLTEGSSADRVLPIMVRRMSRNSIIAQAAVNQVLEVDANSGVNTVHIRQLESAHERTLVRNANLQRELAETRAEVRELRAQQARSDRHIRDIERLLSGSRTHASSSRRR